MQRYPRTPHFENSRLQAGDEEKGRVLLRDLQGCWLVVEEKVDAANSGISFEEGIAVLQSRGHVLTGGPRERQFSRLKSWVECHEASLYNALGERYLMYGEAMLARHTIFYDHLPHLFLEFDIYDKAADAFLCTRARQDLLIDTPVAQVPVLWEGFAPRRLRDLIALVGNSSCRTPEWRENQRLAALRAGVDPAEAAAQSDGSDQMEGLYIKVERNGKVVGRLKWVRSGFVQAIIESESHWADRPMIMNLLRRDVDIFAPQINWDTPGIFGRSASGGYKALAAEPPRDAPGVGVKAIGGRHGAR